MNNDELIGEWYSLRKKIQANTAMMASTVARELELRRLIMFRIWTDTPKEGTNKFEFPGGWVLKGVHKLDRKVDEAALPAVKEQLRSVGVNPDKLIRMTPELHLKEYRLLTDAQRKILDQALDIKPAAPTLEMIGPNTESPE